jgi:hypothetical protein
VNDYVKHETTYEVWRVIKEAHPDLVVFGSYSAPDGDRFGDPTRAVMITSYGFEGDRYPILEARTEWDATHEYRVTAKRENETHKYWLCVSKYDD